MGASAILTGAQTAFGLYGSYQQAQAMKEQGRAEEMLANQNARLIELNAEDALFRGRAEAAEVKRRGRYLKGTQRAGFAGQNIDVSTGTAAAIATETDSMAEADALTVSNNAFREAWGYRTEAINERFRGKMARLGKKSEARYTLLAGGLNAARDIQNGLYLNNKFKSTGFNPSNPTEARFDREYRTRR